MPAWKDFKGIFTLDAALYALLLLAAGFSLWSSRQLGQLQESLRTTTYDLSHPRIGDWLPRMDLPVLRRPDQVAKIAAPVKEGQVLYFFSPACKYCRASQPHVERMYELLEQQGDMEMYAVSMENADMTGKYLRETGSRIPTVVMSGKRESNLFRVSGVPMLLTLNRDGQITYAHYGMINATDVPSASTRDRSTEERESGRQHE